MPISKDCFRNWICEGRQYFLGSMRSERLHGFLREAPIRYGKKCNSSPR